MVLCEKCREALDDPPEQALDVLAKLHNALIGLEKQKAALPKLVDEACDDMREFLATHQLGWHVLKDDAELEEAARAAGFVMAERDGG